MIIRYYLFPVEFCNNGIKNNPLRVHNAIDSSLRYKARKITILFQARELSILVNLVLSNLVRSHKF